MSRILNYKGQLAPGTETTIMLSTKKGEVGYRITKFQIMSSAPGANNSEFIAQIYKTSDSNNINTTPNFSDNRLLAVAYYNDDHNSFAPETIIIFDNEIFNQDVFLNITDASGGAIACNYYLEIEVIKLDESEAMVATLKDIRNHS